MNDLELVLLGDPVLRQVAENVSEGTDVKHLGDSMLVSMNENEGIGLAAPQVGILKRIIAVASLKEGVPQQVIVNPTLSYISDEQDVDYEGCLSIPGIQAPVRRPLRVTVEGFDVNWNPLRIEAQDLYARCLLHEIDHLNGVLFIDHLGVMQRNMLLDKYKKLRKRLKNL